MKKIILLSLLLISFNCALAGGIPLPPPNSYTPAPNVTTSELVLSLVVAIVSTVGLLASVLLGIAQREINTKKVNRYMHVATICILLLMGGNTLSPALAPYILFYIGMSAFVITSLSQGEPLLDIPPD